MPLLEVTGGPIAPSGKALAAGTRLVVIYDQPYVDGVHSYPTNHFAEIDLSNGLWKPLGAPDGTEFYLPGGADTFPVPPKATLHEVQYYEDGSQQSFVRGPLTIIETAAGEWFFPTPAQNVKYLDNPTIPPANAVLESSRNLPGGFAGLDVEGKIVPRLAYEGEPDGVATLNDESLLLQGLAAVSKIASEIGDTDFLFGRLASAPDTIRVRLDELGKYFTSEIVERGGTDSNFYVRFADGTQICALARSDLGGVTQSFGAGYIASTNSLPWPAAFVDRPINVAFPRKGTGNSPVWAGGGTSWGSETLTPNLWLNAWLSFSTEQNGVEYIAIGRWK